MERYLASGTDIIRLPTLLSPVGHHQMAPLWMWGEKRNTRINGSKCSLKIPVPYGRYLSINGGQWYHWGTSATLATLAFMVDPKQEQEGYGPIDFPALVYNWLHLVTCGHNCSQLLYGPNWSQLSHPVTRGHIRSLLWHLVTTGHNSHMVPTGHTWSHLVKSGQLWYTCHIWSLLVT